MNIVITLPEHLINAIVTGEKKVEIRAGIPRHYNCFTSTVFIVEKGTYFVKAWMTLKGFEKQKEPEIVINKYRGKIGVDEKWVRTYMSQKQYVWIWQIMVAKKMKKNHWLFELSGLRRAPQSYVYTKTTLRQINEI